MSYTEYIKKLLKINSDQLVRLKADHKKEKGIVLLSYLNAPLMWSTNDTRLDAHSALWESREIAHIFQTMGFTVDVINWTNEAYEPRENYDIIFDIHTNLQKIAPLQPSLIKKILHLTGSSVQYQRMAELRRVEALEQRKGMLYSPKRIDKSFDLAERSFKVADICSLIGNNATRDTYSPEHKSKIHTVPVSGSRLLYHKSKAKEYVPLEREFIWFYGSGAVHKGLDLVLDVFCKNPRLHLHVVGNVAAEKDFIKIYYKELFETKNITYHGHLIPSSSKFRAIADRVVANIAPSCSEGTSPATVTCLQIGFFPIISVNNGITLPKDTGIYLHKCTHEEIERSVNEVYNMPVSKLSEQIQICQIYGLKNFSRENFSSKMNEFLSYALGFSAEYIEPIT